MADGWEILTDPYEECLEDVCAALWMVLRNVQHWMERTQRGGLFGNRSHRARARLLRAMRSAPALAPALRTFLSLRSNPGTMPPEELGAACFAVWAWAEGESLLGTAAHFVEAAAYLVPEKAAYANDAGWACRRCAFHERAGVWYQRGLRLAVRAADEHEAIRALIGRGTVYRDLGKHERALEYYDRASRRAFNDGKRRQAAVARHYIFALTAERGTFEAGLDEVRETLNLYPIYDPRVPYLAHDYTFLLIRNRYFVPALAMLEKVAPAIAKPEERLLVQSSIAWAAAAAGRHEAHRAAERYVLETAPFHMEYAAASYIHLAHAARFVREWDKAAKYAAHAEEIATRRRTPALREEAATLRLDVDLRKVPEGENPVPCPYEVEVIERTFSIRLRRWLAPDGRGIGANAKPANVADRERKRL